MLKFPHCALGSLRHVLPGLEGTDTPNPGTPLRPVQEDTMRSPVALSSIHNEFSASTQVSRPVGPLVTGLQQVCQWLPACGIGWGQFWGRISLLPPQPEVLGTTGYWVWGSPIPETIAKNCKQKFWSCVQCFNFRHCISYLFTIFLIGHFGHKWAQIGPKFGQDGLK